MLGDKDRTLINENKPAPMEWVLLYDRVREFELKQKRKETRRLKREARRKENQESTKI
jgi:hypothetical protein